MFHRRPGFHSSTSSRLGAYTEFPDEELEQSVAARFERMAERFPDNVAIESREESYTFARMNAAANGFAQAIQEATTNRDQPVALLFDHGAAAIVAIFACLKAGRCYVVLDPGYPVERLVNMHADSGADLIVTGGGHDELVSSLRTSSTTVIDFGRVDPVVDSAERVDQAGPGTPAMLLYTSGSTGTPKAAVHTHVNVLAEVRNLTNLWRIGYDDRFVLCMSISFAHSVRTIFASLLNGASLYPFDLRKYDLQELADWLTEKRITVFRCVPTTFRRFAGSIDDNRKFPDVRIFSIGGETVKPGDIELFNRCFSAKCTLATAFGPTECLTVTACFLEHGVDVSTKSVPIGYPMAHKTALILDDAGAELPANAIGEIAVRSRFIASGYWRRPDLTEQVLSCDPRYPGERTYRTGDLGWRDDNGCYWHAGRGDFQVKIRGFRIEPLEIEHAMLTVPGIRQALATAHEEESTGKRLVAYFVSDDDVALTATQLRNHLASSLPDYMIPSVFIPLASFPTLPNGKTDRNALPPPPRYRPGIDVLYRAPVTAVEAALVETWQKLLGLEGIGIDDPFLELGGDSLLATLMANRIGKDFDIALPLQDIMHVETIRELARMIEQRTRVSVS